MAEPMEAIAAAAAQRGEAAAARSAAGGPASGRVVLLRDRFEVHSGRPLAELDSPQAAAFHAVDRRNPARAVFALILRNDVPHRLMAMRSLKSVQSPGILQMLEMGTETWPLTGRRTLIAVMERPAGPRLMTTLIDTVEPMPDQMLIRRVARPITAALAELTNKGIPHRAIRPTNLFFTDREQERVALGECFTSAPGSDQPSIFETIPAAMCDPAGRGIGRTRDDIFSLGATLLVLALGRNPVSHLSETELMAARLSQGSFQALIGDARLSLNLSELLRGLLHDSDEERWTLQVLDQWLNGRRLPPLPQRLETRASRPFPFEGVNYFTGRELALAFSNNWDAAVTPIRDGSLQTWLKRSLENADAATAVGSAVTVADTAGDRRVGNDQLVARVCYILDPKGPIRYREIRVAIDGIGPLLASIMARKGNVRVLCDAIIREMPLQWITDRNLMGSGDYSQWATVFRDQKTYLQQAAKGLGVERCLYELNETLPCQSPLLDGEYVVEIKEILPALDVAARRVDTKAWPVDRHVAAFISAKYAKETQTQFATLNDSRPERAAVGMVGLLALLQWRLGPETLHHLCAWAGGLLAPVLNGYRSRERRRKVEREIPRIVRRGSLPDLYNLIDDPDERRADREGFAKAQQDWQEKDIEIRRLENGQVQNEKAFRIGHQISATVSVILAFMTFIGAVLNQFL